MCVLHTKGVILSKEWVWWHTYIGCDVVYNGYDVIYGGWDLINTVGEISSIQWMLLQRYSRYNLKYTGCDVKHIGVWCHKEFMWCHAYWIWCHTYSVCEVIQRVGVVYLIPWVWWHRYSGYSVRYSGWDRRYNVCVVMCMMSYIVCVMHESSGCNLMTKMVWNHKEWMWHNV